MGANIIIFLSNSLHPIEESGNPGWVPPAGNNQAERNQYNDNTFLSIEFNGF